MKGNNIKLSFGSDEIASATSVGVELMQEAVEYTPVPGSSADDGWRHYRPGMRSWNIDSDGFFTSENSSFIDNIYGNTLQAVAHINIDDILELRETVHLSEVTVIGKIRSMARLSIKFECDNYPELIEL